MISQPCLRGGNQQLAGISVSDENSCCKFDDCNDAGSMKTGLSFPNPAGRLVAMLKTIVLLLGMIGAASAQVITTNLNLSAPEEFILIDKTLTRLTFSWKPNQETNIWGYYLYWGPAYRFYTNYKVFRHDESCGMTNCANYMYNISRTNRTWFALSAVNTALIESELTTNEIVFPAIIGTNYVVSSIYDVAESLDGPWTTTLILTNRLVVTNKQFFIRNRMRVDRVR